MRNNLKLAVLLTCYNRKDKTIECLTALNAARLKGNFIINTYLVDDGSKDGTEDAVKSKFPEVVVIKGTGNLYWNGGMRLAWQVASGDQEYDYYLWLNDDTLLVDYALNEMFECETEAENKDGKPALIVGACKESEKSDSFSYGGRDAKDKPLLPNGSLQLSRFINGNAVLVPKKIYNTVGNLSAEYTHAMGDVDYGLRANQKGFNCYTTKKYVGICPPNQGIPAWQDPAIPVVKRWKIFHSPKGLNMKEYNTFRRKFWGWKWIIFAVKAYSKMLMPQIYQKISKK